MFSLSSFTVLGGCDGIFADASHCWPFNDAIANVSPDLKGGFPATLEVSENGGKSLNR